MSQQSVMDLLEKHPEGLTVTEMHKLLGGSRGSLGTSVRKLRDSEDIFIGKYINSRGMPSPVYILK